MEVEKNGPFVRICLGIPEEDGYHDLTPEDAMWAANRMLKIASEIEEGKESDA